MDLLIAPLVFRILIMDGDSGDEYLDTLTAAVGAGLEAAGRAPDGTATTRIP